MIKSLSTKYYRDISKGKPHLEKQYRYDPKEKEILSYEDKDPLGENSYKVSSSLIHRYRDRVLLLVTDSCALYCRHCFRREFIDSGSSISDRELEETCNYIKEHKEVYEILLSGGDPLTLAPERVDFILGEIRRVRPDILIRIGSRVPIVDPDRVTNELVNVLSKYTPLWLAIQCNHSDELTERVKIGIDRLIGAGINLVNQAVLLRGVNDNLEALKSLSHRLLEFRIKPYYIFQGDLAPGTGHLRVPIKKGLELMEQLRGEVSGLGMATYAVDIPGGGGKIPLISDYITGEDKKWIYLTNRKGFNGRYPKEL